MFLRCFFKREVSVSTKFCQSFSLKLEKTTAIHPALECRFAQKRALAVTGMCAGSASQEKKKGFQKLVPGG
jgi:hypothetical protein